MAGSIKKSPQNQSGGRQSPSIVTLAAWQLRQTWRLLLVIGLGIVASVILVCSVLLYSQLAMTAGLRTVLTSSVQNADIVVRSSSTRISTPVIDITGRHLNAEFQKQLGPYIAPQQFSLLTQPFSILKSVGGQLHSTPDVIALTSSSMQEAASHVTLLQGRLPQTNSDEIEIAIRPESADLLHVSAGSVLNTTISFLDANQTLSTQRLTLRITGIFVPGKVDDPFWHGNDFMYSFISENATFYRGLVSNETILSHLSQISDKAASSGKGFERPANVFWYYRMNTSQITISDLDNVIAGAQTVKVDDSNNTDLEQSPYLEESVTYLPSDILQRYQGRIAIAQLPITGLLLLVLGLILFFVSTMVDLLVDRQSEAISILRSRGASQQQVFGALVIQSIALGLLALIAGPILAILIVRLLVQSTLPLPDQSVLNSIFDNPLQAVVGISGYVLVAIAATIATMILAIRAAIHSDVLAFRRESARSTHRPMWQRFNLDIVAGILALCGYGFSLYLTDTGILDAQLRLLLLSPLTMLETILLLLACVLLLLRFFPRFLQLGARVAASSTSASPLLALAQMARTPHQSLRMTLLLALASGFAIFTLIFNASQAQRILDVANYQGGADFSGWVPSGIVTPDQLTFETAAYQHIRGVTSVALGYVTTANAGSRSIDITIDFKAVDADKFARTALWTAQDSAQPLTSLMAQLSAQRQNAISRRVVPAIVDSSTWNALHLSPGANFTLNFALQDYNDLVKFSALAEVQHIPTSGNSAIPGILVDYQSYALVYAKNVVHSGTLSVPLNFVWLRTRDDPASLKSVRDELMGGNLQLDPYYDRRAMLENLQNDPLYLALTGVLSLGAVTALLLALVGNLITSWFSAHHRLTNFAVLRALGSSQRQVAGVLLWEQSIIYAVAILLGFVFGILLSALVLPALIFTSVPSIETNGVITGGDFYAIQSVPPIEVIIPFTLGIALVLLLAICTVAIGIMVRVVSRPSLSQVLRLNAD